MRSNFLNFTRMQVAALSQIACLQLLCCVLMPVFFHPININNDLANVITYTTGLLLLSYLILRNFAFNDEKYKTKLLFSILPVTPNTILGARGMIIYLFCLIGIPIWFLFSRITHIIRPEIFAVMQPHILPCVLLIFSVFLPIEFLIFYMFEAQKADIIGAFVMFPYMGLMAILYNSFLSATVFIIAVFTNVFCYRLSIRLYKNRE